MKAGYWIAMVVALVVGIIVGFGLGANPGKIAGLEKQIQQLTAENAALKSTLATPPPPPPGAGLATTEPTKQR